MDKKSEAKVYKSYKDYVPLLILLVVLFIAASSLQMRMAKWSLRCWITTYMGLFFISVSLFRFLDFKGFASGFRIFDVLANQIKSYAYIYPFLEVLLGIGYLSYRFPFWTNLATLLVMGLSAYGVIKAIANGMDVICSYKGSILKIPLSSLILVETVLMGALSLILLGFRVSSIF